MNQKLIIIPIIILVVGACAYFIIPPSENHETSSKKFNNSLDPESEKKLIQTEIKSLFKVFAYEEDSEIINGLTFWSNVYYEFDESKSEIYKNLINNKKSVVVYPIFTAAAYSEPGFYTFYRGECDAEFHGVLFRDDDCLTVKLDENVEPSFVSSGLALQIFTLLDYDIISDITIHKNPEILSTYDKIILLHNEYVTSIEFEAITSHPNVIYLYPNAL